MAIEQTGPGGVGNNYGTRTTNQPTQINSTDAKTVYGEYNPTPNARYTLDANNEITGIEGVDLGGGGVELPSTHAEKVAFLESIGIYVGTGTLVAGTSSSIQWRTETDFNNWEVFLTRKSGGSNTGVLRGSVSGGNMLTVLSSDGSDSGTFVYMVLPRTN